MIWFKYKFALHIYKLWCTCSANFVKIHPVVFEIPRAEDFFTKNFKNLYQMNNFKLKKKSKHILAILFLHILHIPSFKKLALIATEI